MDQKPKPGYLFFTPRAPNGKRLSHLRFRHHLRASEDQVPYPASMTIQDLDEQKAPSQLGASIAPNAQAGSSSGVWRVPHTTPQGYQVPQQQEPPVQQRSGQTPYQFATTQDVHLPWRYSEPVAFPNEKKESNWSGSISRNGVRGPKDGPDETQVVVQYSTNPSVRDSDNRKQKVGRPTPRTPVQIDQQEFEDAVNPEGPEED